MTSTYQDAYFFTQNTIKPAEGPGLKALLDKYAPKFVNDNGEVNTTDQFLPGTKFYRPVEKNA